MNRHNIYEKFEGHCAYCGVEINFRDMQVDHIIPQRNYENYVKNNFRVPKFLQHLTLSDLNHFDNLHPACRICNKWKSTFDLELFRSELGEQLTRLNLRSTNYRIAKMYGQIRETPEPIIFYFEKQNNEFQSRDWG